MNFDWDEANLQHLARHGVAANDSEEVLQNSPVETDAEWNESDGWRFRYVGETNAGRIMEVIMTWRGQKARIISAWDAPRALKRSYLEWRMKEHGI